MNRASLLLVALVLSPPVLAQSEPTLPRGFAANSVYSTGQVDNVNLFGGSLSLSVPIGQSYPVGGAFSYQLQLVYSSNIWKYYTTMEPGLPNVEVQYAELDTTFNAGPGWRLSFGELYREVVGGDWYYRSADGAEHKFHQKLHNTHAESDSSTQYTRDSSFLRLKTGGAYPVIEFPDGTKHSFNESNSLLKRATKIEDPFGNSLSIGYAANLWTLTDSLGRVHQIDFETKSDGRKHVDQVRMQAFGGTTATYDFIYQDDSNSRIRRTCRDELSANNVDPQDPKSEEAMISTPLLMRVNGPEANLDWKFVDSGSADYHRGDVRANTEGCIQAGLILGTEIPTGGKIAWTWRTWGFPQGGRLRQTAAPGVATRTVTNTQPANVSGTWIYTSVVETVGSFPDQMKVTVEEPGDFESIHYFTAKPSGPNLPWEYGLPYSARSADMVDGKYLSRTIKRKSPSNEIIRKFYVLYEHDPIPSPSATLPNDILVQSNRRVVEDRVLFYDDTNGQGQRTRIDTDRSNWDGLGHYRVATVSDNFETTTGSRTERVEWNPGNSTGSLPAPGASWLLTDFEYRTQQEGGNTHRQDYVFTSEGMIRSLRTRRNSGGTGPQDLVTLVCHDSTGNVSSERFYGGDIESVPSPVPGCGATSGWSHRINYDYSAGVRNSARHIRPNGGTFPHYDYFAEIDFRTGLVKKYYDSSNYHTTYSYDRAGRLTNEDSTVGSVPSRAASVSYSYGYSTTDGHDVVISMTCPTGASGCNQVDFPRKKVYFDGFGRPYKEARKNFDDVAFSKKVTARNIHGYVDRVTEWMPEGGSDMSGPATYYREFDAFGRPEEVELPDGQIITFIYNGARRVYRTVKVAMASVDASNRPLTNSQTRELYDRGGRLVKVVEPAGAGGAEFITEYSYAVGGQLAQVRQDDGVNEQTRTFLYDARGFLTDETHPEKGSTGGGTVEYGNYDSLGHAGYRWDTTSARGARFVYDKAERLLQVENAAGTVLKEFAYDEGSGHGQWSTGKLTTARAFNDFSSEIGQSITVEESYVYDGVAGAVSGKTTRFIVNGTPQESFHLGMDYDPAGQTTSIDYPSCTGGACASLPVPTRTVDYWWRRGYMIGVGAFANQIKYHGNGLVSEIKHVNGMRWAQGVNGSNGMARPQTINVYVAPPAGGAETPIFLSGNFVYDGAGNISDIGPHRYQYDGVSRLVASREYWNPNHHYESTTFDAFGNIQAQTTGGVPRNMATSKASNRLVNAVSYDNGGNLTAWNGAFYFYDDLNRMRRMQNGFEDWLFAYTADDERVWRYRVGNAEEYWTIRGLDGKVLREFDAEHPLGYDDNVWRGGALLAVVDADQLCTRPELGQETECFRGPEDTRHVAIDHLGSARLFTSTPAFSTDPPALVSARHFFPFGQELTTSTDSESHMFAGHERDRYDTSSKADDLDYMHARFEKPLLARFLSFDPAGASRSRPQSWNRYAMVEGNPIGFVDPSGRLRIRAERIGFSGQVNYRIGLETKLYLVTEVANRFAGGAKGLIGVFSKAAKNMRQVDVLINQSWVDTQSTLGGKFSRSDFEGRVESHFLSRGVQTAQGGSHIPGANNLHDRQELGVLQDSINQVISQMEQNKEISAEEAETLRQEYDLDRLEEDARKKEMELRRKMEDLLDFFNRSSTGNY